MADPVVATRTGLRQAGDLVPGPVVGPLVPVRRGCRGARRCAGGALGAKRRARRCDRRLRGYWLAESAVCPAAARRSELRALRARCGLDGLAQAPTVGHSPAHMAVGVDARLIRGRSRVPGPRRDEAPIPQASYGRWAGRRGRDTHRTWSGGVAHPARFRRQSRRPATHPGVAAAGLRDPLARSLRRAAGHPHDRTRRWPHRTHRARGHHSSRSVRPHVGAQRAAFGVAAHSVAWRGGRSRARPPGDSRQPCRRVGHYDRSGCRRSLRPGLVARCRRDTLSVDSRCRGAGRWSAVRLGCGSRLSDLRGR